MSDVIVVGLNQRTVPLDVLERLTVSPVALPKVLADLASGEHVRECAVLSTCLRTEFVLVADRFHAAVQDARNVLASLSGLPPESFADHLYTYFDEPAVTHLFQVAAGLDSAVLGEGEILAQVREAIDVARAEGAAGPVLEVLFRHAVEVGKRARTETAIARGITSVSQAAVAMADERLGGLAGRRVLVLGAGDMGEGMAAALAATPGVDEVLVANRTWGTAVAVANRVGGRPVALGSLGSALADVDVLLTSTGSPGVLLEAADLAPVLAERADRPLLVVDIAVPRDVDPGVGRLPGVTLLDMEDLRAFAEIGIAGRRREIAKVQAIVEDEVVRHGAVASARQVAPLVAALHRRGEDVRQAELDRFRAALDTMDDAQRAAVEALTKGIVAKLAHAPTVALKEAAGTGQGERLASAAEVLFDL